MRRIIKTKKRTMRERKCLLSIGICTLLIAIGFLSTIGARILMTEIVFAEEIGTDSNPAQKISETTTTSFSGSAPATSRTTVSTGTDTSTTCTSEPVKYDAVPIQMFRVMDIVPNVEATLDYTDWWYSDTDNCHYLFLPSTAERADLKLICSSNKGTVYLNDTAIVSGAVTNILSTADTFSVRVNNIDCGILKVLQSDIGCVFLSTPSGSLDYLDKRNGNAESGTILMMNAQGGIEYQGEMEKIAGRGNSSWDYSLKKPYNIKLPTKENLYSMGAAKKWAFLSNYLDHTMLRNAVAMTLSEEAGSTFTMKYVYVDLYADGSYRGTYQIMQRVQIQQTRVAIQNLEEETEEVNTETLSSYKQVIVGGDKASYAAGVYKYWDIPNNPVDISGGYLLQFQTTNRYPKAESGFVTTRGQCIEINGPEYCTQSQLLYIRTFVQELEDAIYSADGYNAKGKHYSEYLDMDSIALSYLIQEITSNPDGSFTSFYFWKESDLIGDGKLHCGPVWDFDLALANFGRIVSGHGSNNPATLFAAFMPIYRQSEDTMEPYLGWLGTLYQRDSFVQRVATAYYDHFDDTLSMLLDSSEGSIIQMGAALSKSAAMNNGRWNMLGKNRRLGPVNGYTYEETLEYIRNFLSKRQTFLRNEWIIPACETLIEKLSERVIALTLTKYDTAGQIELAKLQQNGADAIRATKTYEAGYVAFEQAVASFETVPRMEISGDFNDDGVTNYSDATALLVYYTESLAGLQTPISATQMRNGDVDKNGVLNAVDAMHILRYAVAKTAGIEYLLPVVAS